MTLATEAHANIPDILAHTHEEAHLGRGGRGGHADGAHQHGPRHAHHGRRHLRPVPLFLVFFVNACYLTQVVAATLDFQLTQVDGGPYIADRPRSEV